MNGYEASYNMFGQNFNLPMTTSLEIGTGQGWNSQARYRGAMSMVAHIAARLLLGKAKAPDKGQIQLELFSITILGMKIIQLCHEFIEDGAFVSI